MAQLSTTISDLQREAAGLPTGDLRATLQACLELLAEFIEALQGIGPGASMDEIENASGDVLYTALFTAVHLQELATRPAERFARVRLSIN